MNTPNEWAKLLQAVVRAKIAATGTITLDDFYTIVMRIQDEAMRAHPAKGSSIHNELNALGIPQYDEKQHPLTALDRLRLLVMGYKDRLGDADDRADKADNHYQYLMNIIGCTLDGSTPILLPDEPEVNKLLEAIRKALSHKIVDVDFEVEPIEGAWWMVFNPYPRGRKPEIRHTSRGVAIEEAKRLAAKEGNKVHVLEKVFTAQPPPKPAEIKAQVWCDHIKWGQYWHMGDFEFKPGWVIQLNGVEFPVPDDWVHCPINHCNAERPF